MSNKNTNLNIRCKEDLKQILNNVAELMDVKPSDLARDILYKELSKMERRLHRHEL